MQSYQLLSNATAPPEGELRRDYLRYLTGKSGITLVNGTINLSQENAYVSFFVHFQENLPTDNESYNTQSKLFHKLSTSYSTTFSLTK